ncbi:hypothetical protein OUY22_12170 [Nonomuraea sp. MCN248]|uniref:Uncharacterized protein n=1 Tax=Nonomuraea corallina TaxID=2989783 RepID=A0ABT4SAT3_9ACTN|nr:hypothetical protein [Nonomuraea corallina]MDA0634173.1 hypothetical protein [Nonomuraea corallina]
MNFCLSDLVPPLRWSDTSTITLLTGQPGLPDAWWRSLPMPRVLAAIGPESLGELLTEIAIEHWPAAAVGDVLPALHMLDPDEADEPYVAIALDRAGSWPGLLALTGRELMDQPFVQARPVLTALFSSALLRLSPAAPVSASGAATLDEETPAPAPASHEPAHPVDHHPTDGDQEHHAAEHHSAAAPVGEEPDSSPSDGDAAEERAEAHAGPDRPAQDAERDAKADAAEADAAEADDDPGHEHHAEEPAEPDPVAQNASPGPGPQNDGPGPAEEGDGAAEGETEDEEADLPRLIEAAFAHLDDKSWAVAQNRVFTDQPSAVDQLAKLFAVPPTEIAATEDRLRAMLDEWLASDEAAPYRAHLEELREKIGPSAPKERLIQAADWHGREIKALEVPAWQFVLATLPDRPLPARKPVPPSAFSAPYGPPPAAFAPKQPPHPGLPPGFVPPDPVPSQFQAFAPAVPVQSETNGAGSGEQPGKPYQPLKDVSQTRRCFRQPDGRWWLRVDVTAEQLSGGECALPTGFAAYLGLSPGESRTVRSAAGELTMTWHGRPVLESIDRLLADVGAKEGGHLFLTLSDEGVLRARHLPVAAAGAEKITKALRLVGYTAPGGTRDQAARVIATRIGMTGPVNLPDLLTRLRERGDRDLLHLLD